MLSNEEVKDLAVELDQLLLLEPVENVVEYLPGDVFYVTRRFFGWGVHRRAIKLAVDQLIIILDTVHSGCAWNTPYVNILCCIEGEHHNLLISPHNLKNLSNSPLEMTDPNKGD